MRPGAFEIGTERDELLPMVALRDSHPPGRSDDLLGRHFIPHKLAISSR
jgi:hypothetical protein